MDDLGKELTAKSNALFRALRDLAKELNELGETAVCASVDGWKFDLEKTHDVEEIKQ